MTSHNTFSPGKLEQTDSATAEPFTLSRNPNRALQEMMDTINALREIYEEENRLLQEADTKGFTALLDRKLLVARDYQEGAAQMLERREEFKKADPDLKKKLTQAHESFAELASTNLESLDRTRKAVQRLGDRIMGAARDAVRKESVSYSASGSLSGGERAVSIGLNESA